MRIRVGILRCKQPPPVSSLGDLDRSLEGCTAVNIGAVIASAAHYMRRVGQGQGELLPRHPSPIPTNPPSAFSFVRTSQSPTCRFHRRTSQYDTRRIVAIRIAMTSAVPACHCFATEAPANQ